MNIGIIGGGASGMMAAVTAAKEHNVTILEHGQRIGKKLLVTGNGRCNYTNEDMDISHFHGTDLSFISNVLDYFGYNRTIDFFKCIGVYPKSRNGYIYPFSDQASSVLDCFLMELKRLNVNIVTECNITRLVYDTPDNTHSLSSNPANTNHENSYVFKVSTDKGNFLFDKLIIATGSCAAAKTGSDGSGYGIAQRFGVEINRPLPALCSLVCKENIYKSVAGVRCPATVSIFVNDEFKKSDTGELQLTDYGISGIPVFQISYIAAKALSKKKSVVAQIDFMPELKCDELCKLISDRIGNDPDKTTEEMLIGLFNKKLCTMFIKCAEAEANAGEKVTESILNRKCGMLDSKMIFHIVNAIKNFKTEIVNTNSFENAQVCTGGVKLTELKDTLECRKVPGLYFAGEILDVNGDCGGYNLQWAWSSGYLAGCLS